MSSVEARVGVGLALPAVDSPRFAQRLVKKKVAFACLAFLGIVTLVGVIAPIALPHVASERAGNLLATHQGPSSSHLLGTDTLGRDVLNRLLVGTRVTVIGIAEALATVLLLGVPAGLAAGFLGGLTDGIVSRFVDLAFGIPSIIIILIVLAVFPGSMLAGMVAYGVLAAPGLIRVVRSAVLPIREQLYIAAARVSGLTKPQIMVRHVLPRISGPLIVQTSLLAAGALLVQTGLSFLGLLVAAPTPSWGGMVADGWSVIVLQPWLLWPPGLAIAFTILAFGLLGDAVRDAAAETWAPPQQGLGRLRTRRFLPASVSASSKSQSSDALLAIEGLSVGFRTASGMVKRVIDNLSFEIAAGETVGLVGESGSGKSVTALSILDLLPAGGMIEHGEIYFDGKSLTKMHEAQLHEHRGSAIGLISQEPMASLNPAFRIGAQLAEVVRRHHHVSRRSARRRAVDLLSQVRLPEPDDVARRYPHELSGGMAQRVSIARALAGDPRLLIADEPTTALDVTLQAEILELLRTLQAQRAMSILLVTHDWGVVADICDRAVVLYAGQVVECAEVSTVYRQPLHPYTEALLAANPHGAEAGVSLPTIPGAVPNPGSWPTGCHFHPRCSYATDACRERPIPIERPSRDHQTRCIHYGRVGTK